MLGMVVFLMLYVWLMVHVFRLEWVQAREEELGLDVAIAERRAEAGDASPDAPPPSPSDASPRSTPTIPPRRPAAAGGPR